MVLVPNRAHNNKELARLRKAIVTGQHRTLLRAAEFMKANAKVLAPRKTGKLVSGIRRRGKGGRQTVFVDNSVRGKGGFPYALWVNGSAGYRRLHYPNGAAFSTTGGLKIFIKPGEVLEYGKSPSNWNWTAKSFFFWDVARRRTQKEFKRIAIRQMNNQLKVKI